MNTAAILNSDGLVTNLIIADYREIPGAVDGAGGAIGDTWDGVRFIRAEQSPLPLQFPQFVGNEKLDLFTPQVRPSAGRCLPELRRPGNRARPCPAGGQGPADARAQG